MPQSYEHRDEREMSENGSLQPADCVVIEVNAFQRGEGDRLDAALQDGDNAPDDQYYNHHCRELHDAQRLLAGFMNPDDVFAPEIQGYEDGKKAAKDGGSTFVLGEFSRSAVSLINPAR